MFSRFAARIAIVLLAFAPVPASAGNEDVRIPRDLEPIVRVWYPATIAADHQRFLDELANPPEPSPATDAPAEADAALPPTDSEREGVLVYFDPLRFVPIESHESPSQRSFSDAIFTVRFRKISSGEEFEDFVRKETRLETNPSSGTLRPSKDGFVFEPDWVSVTVYPQRWSAIPGLLTATSRYWRYHDGYVFHGNAAEILTMDLPDARELEPSPRAAKRDIFARRAPSSRPLRAGVSPSL
jgi:hypothetical protein